MNSLLNFIQGTVFSCILLNVSIDNTNILTDNDYILIIEIGKAFLSVCGGIVSTIIINKFSYKLKSLKNDKSK